MRRLSFLPGLLRLSVNELPAARYTIGFLGTGAVARALAERLQRAGHAVVFGSRDPAAAALSEARVLSYAEAASDADIVFNTTPGAVSLSVLDAIDPAALAGKVVVDVANGIVRSETGRTLRFPGTSIAEQIQELHQEARVVKTLNTVHTSVMSDPSATGTSTAMFVSGNDADAKATVAALLVEMGWDGEGIVDLGGITAARGQEAYLLFLNDLIGALGTPTLNISIHHTPLLVA
jgi:8-hydroxy-5-deazaflavin:NADPH oxidoreductase